MTIADQIAARPVHNIRLDDRAYFKKFCRAHGEAIEIGGRLYFPDGWGYSSTSYSGPEYPPPKDADQKQRIQVAYWKKRRRMFQRERRALEVQLIQLKESQIGRSVPLQVVEVVQGAGGRPVLEQGELDLGPTQHRVRQCVTHAEKCDKELEALGAN